jgi:hypothetical protein
MTDKRMRAAGMAGGRLEVRDIGKKKTPARYFLRTQFFDY